MRQKKVLLFGHEIGGQMQLLASALRERGIPATAMAVNNDWRGYLTDVPLGLARDRYGLKRLLLFPFLAKFYDVFHFFWGVSLVSVWRFHLMDLPLLKKMGKTVLVHFRGLDLIDIKTFDIARERILQGDGIVGTSSVSLYTRKDSAYRLRQWRKYADCLLVSEPDLLEVVPEAVLSPQVIDARLWGRSGPAESTRDGVVRIVHAPSLRRKKGTEFVIRAVEELKREMPVELILVEGVNHRGVKSLYERADIAVDQVLYGWHGKFSVEAMALEMPVVCYIREDLRALRPDLPIVSSTPLTLKDRLRELVLDERKREELGKKGREYVLKYHDIEPVLSQLIKLYGLQDLLD